MQKVAIVFTMPSIASLLGLRFLSHAPFDVEIMLSTKPVGLSANVNAPRTDDFQAQTRFYEENLLISTWTSSTICFVAACIAVSLRLYSRKLKGQTLAWDDYIILISMMFYVPFYVTVVLGLVWAGGPVQLMTDLEYANYEQVNSKVYVASSTISSVPLFFAKVGDAF